MFKTEAELLKDRKPHPVDRLAQRALHSRHILHELARHADAQGMTRALHDCGSTALLAGSILRFASDERGYDFVAEADKSDSHSVFTVIPQLDGKPSYEQAEQAVAECERRVGILAGAVPKTWFISGVRSVRILRGDHALRGMVNAFREPNGRPANDA